MKINFDSEVTREDGSSIKRNITKFRAVQNEAGQFVSEEYVVQEPITLLSNVCSEVLSTVILKVSIEETMERFHLYNKIVNGGEVDLSKEELDKIKVLINNKYDLMMAGTVLVMLGEK